MAFSGSGCTSTMMPSAPTAAAARLSGSTRSRRPAAWLGSTMTGRWLSSLSTGTAVRSSVKRYAVSKVRMPRSQRMTASLPSLSTYSAAMSSSSSVLDRPRLISTGQFGAADLGQQRVVLHVARADLDDVGHLEHRLEVARVHQLGHDRQPGQLLGLGQQPQALLTQALEGVRARARLVGAAAQHRRAGLGDDLGRGQGLVARLDRARPGDEREVLAADLAAPRSRARFARRA